MPTKSEAKDLLGMFVVLVVAFSIYMIIQEVEIMTRPIRLPQMPQSEKDRREEYRRKEQDIEDARYEAYLKKLNRLNNIGVKKK